MLFCTVIVPINDDIDSLLDGCFHHSLSERGLEKRTAAWAKSNCFAWKLIFPACLPRDFDPQNLKQELRFQFGRTELLNLFDLLQNHDAFRTVPPLLFPSPPLDVWDIHRPETMGKSHDNMWLGGKASQRRLKANNFRHHASYYIDPLAHSPCIAEVLSKKGASTPSHGTLQSIVAQPYEVQLGELVSLSSTAIGQRSKVMPHFLFSQRVVPGAKPTTSKQKTQDSQSPTTKRRYFYNPLHHTWRVAD